MFIVINCLGLPFNGETIKGASLGGSETAAYYMAKELVVLGHKVTMFTTSEQEGVWDGVKYCHAGDITEQTPLGNRFHHYASATPTDVMIIQRHPYAFRYRWASKVNLWWVHDLAQVHRKGEVQQQLWNIDGILTVSKFHKDQYVEVYGLNPDIVYPIQNGIDLSLFEKGITEVLFGKWFGTISNPKDAKSYIPEFDGQTKLLYTSRPERGLEHLVAPNGIMDRLAKIDSKYHLYVCGYDNTTDQMRPYYEYLWNRCKELPNVTHIGSLTKQELADVMRQCDALVYPTPGPQQPGFEEVSCITAMECMAAGLPFISSNAGALPETCEDSGSILIPLKDGMPDIEAFVATLSEGGAYSTAKGVMGTMQLEAAKRYDWSIAAQMTLDHIHTIFKRYRSDGAVLRNLVENSDIYAANRYTSSIDGENAIVNVSIDEIAKCYGFAFNYKFKEHYEAYYEYEKERGVNYGPESLDDNDRFEYVSLLISRLNADAVVLDYGCAHGHYTVNLAKRFPDKIFVGVDIAKSNIEKAERWANEEGVKNVRFIHGWIKETGTIGNEQKDNISLGTFDAIIAAEVIEHIADPGLYVDTLCRHLVPKGQMIITTPYGPWEAQGYREHYPWRAHLWHFERQDLHDLWGHMDGFSITVACSGLSKFNSAIGSFITVFNKTKKAKTKEIDYKRKFSLLKPRQTVSTCMIAGNAASTIKETLDSIRDISDEVIIAIDETTTDRTEEVIENWVKDNRYPWPAVTMFKIKSPREIGFDAARNKSIEYACGDWILWIDADEKLVNSENVLPYLRNNQFEGYAIKQHHFAVEPLGLLNTDLPCRLFRNNGKVRFFGVVHEHPETEINKGLGHVQLLPDVDIAHGGYTTENIRRKRFHRNIGLLARDREMYPERKIGKYLWIRDLAQMCKYEAELNGGRITLDMKERAIQGIALWEELLKEKEVRMLVDSLQFYSILSKIVGDYIEAGFILETSKMNGGINLKESNPVFGHFSNTEHLKELLDVIYNEKVKDYGSKYY